MMATTETTQQIHDRTDRPGRRRPFSTWMKKLANFKGGSSADSGSPAGAKRNTYQMRTNGKKPQKNNPYPESGQLGNTPPHRSFSTIPTGAMSTTSLDRRRSFRSSLDGPDKVTTDHDAAHSDAAPSHAPSSGQGTNTTAVSGRADSTFSSPAHSTRSLTTLTTIQSIAPQPVQIQFVHQFPTSPPTALPAHLVGGGGSGGHPATYNTATANNLLTDNASILTLASSSKRRRRRSMDTDASVRALAPSSLFGGSRESLPLSVLDPHQTRERASIYSATGVAPALPSERNSYYAGKMDGSSVKSGLLGHGRNDSISGSIGVSPLASPRDLGKLSSAGEKDDEVDEKDDET